MGSVKIKDVKAGDVLIADAGFTCVGAGAVTIAEDEHGLYFPCSEGHHYIDGQLDFDDQETLVGLSRPREAA